MVANVATITSKGQVTIPKEIRRALAIEERYQLLFIAEGDRAVLIPLRRRPLANLYGSLPATRPYPGHQTIREELHRTLGERLVKGDE